MPSLEDYTEITLDTAGKQWEQILARRPSLPGTKRQEDFTPVETLLCLAASLIVDRRRYGGRNIHLTPSPIPEMAELFQRTRGSLLRKLGNLDGSSPNSARYEVEVASALLDDLPRLEKIYQTILKAGRAAGISPDRLPDFLNIEAAQPGDPRLSLLGQEELHAEDLEKAIIEEVAKKADRGEADEDPVTVKSLEVNVRVGQHRFAREVLRNCGNRCVFCGMSPGVHLTRRHLLRASHIKPWRDSADRERVDVANGLAACPNHDAAFDAGLIYVNDDMSIGVSPELAAEAERNPAVAAAFCPPNLAAALQLPEHAKRPRKKYLEWHRSHVVRGGTTHA